MNEYAIMMLVEAIKYILCAKKMTKKYYRYTEKSSN